MIEIKVDDREIIDALNELLIKTGDLTPVLSEIGEVLVKSTKKRFEDGEAPDGSKWAPNSPTTVKRKGHNRPLIGSKRLANEIAPYPERKRVTIGSSLVYAATQHFGAKKGSFRNDSITSPWGDIPARTILGVSNKDQVNIWMQLRTICCNFER